MDFKVGERCEIIGLKQRLDLNGKICTLVKWNRKFGRWIVSFDGNTGSCVRVKTSNLKRVISQDDEEIKGTCFRSNKLDPFSARELDKAVRGGSELERNSNFVSDGLIGNGQISYLHFSTLAEIVTECYGTTDANVLAMFLEHIGKDGDSILIQKRLKERIDDAESNLLFPPTSFRFTDKITIKNLGNLMFNMRKGVLAFIEVRVSLISNVAGDLKGCKLNPNNPKSPLKSMLDLGTGGDSKSINYSNLADEIYREADCGEVNIVGGGANGTKRIEVNLFLHRIYIHWLFDDVRKTLSISDARKGSLGKWHSLGNWEIELTSLIKLANHRLILDVSDDFEPFLWLDGLSTFNLDILSDTPGVDADRRILRIAFFAELAWNFVVRNMDKKRGHSNSPSVCTSAGDRNLTNIANDSEGVRETRKFKKGCKVIVLDIRRKQDKGKSAVRNGMRGLVVQQKDHDHYAVSFTNLNEPQTLHASNLAEVRKVKRAIHFCICGERGDFLCSRCGMMWYCGAICQEEHSSQHRLSCKALSPEYNIMDLMS